MSSSTALRSIEPSLCEQILEHRDQWKREELEGIRSLIERGIENKQMVSLKQFCRLHDLSLSLVISQLPELKRSYEQRYSSFRSGQRSQQYESLQREVNKAVSMLLERGDYPSAGSVILLKPTLSRAGWDLIQRAIQVAQESTTKLDCKVT